jgi:hypothetical protein
MISASSSSTFRAVRKLAVRPLVFLECHRTWPVLLSQRGYHAEGQTSEQRRQPPQPVPASSRMRPKKGQSLSDPSDDNPGRPRVPRNPHALSKKLTNLHARGRLDEAVLLLQSLPPVASNVKTWNTLLRLCMMEKRFKLGYKLFTHVCVPFVLNRLWRIILI